ncbi:MAG: hypothetical protein HDP28_01340 [Clostridia bacterium]|nr:hypothetical protein [Clostridia bacterium]
MNVKKYLKKQAKEDLKALETDSDREFLARLKESVAENPKPKRNKNWLWAIPSSVAVCAAILVGTLVPLSGGSDIKYDDLNFVQAKSDLTEFVGASKGLTVQFTEGQTVEVKRTYDSVSGDDIYYTLSINETSVNAYYTLEARVIVNKKYEFKNFVIDEDYDTKIYAHYSIIYKQDVTVDTDTGVNLVTCNAKIDKLKYDIYVTNYEELSIENGSFLTVIANLFDFN